MRRAGTKRRSLIKFAGAKVCVSALASSTFPIGGPSACQTRHALVCNLCGTSAPPRLRRGAKFSNVSLRIPAYDQSLVCVSQLRWALATAAACASFPERPRTGSSALQNGSQISSGWRRNQRLRLTSLDRSRLAPGFSQRPMKCNLHSKVATQCSVWQWHFPCDFRSLLCSGLALSGRTDYMRSQGHGRGVPNAR